jgi:hypothetical protein
MQKMFRIKYLSLLTLLGIILGLSGCSTLGLYEPAQPQSRNLPAIPEIKTQDVESQKPLSQTNMRITSRVTNPVVIQTTQPEISEQDQKAAEELLKAQAKERATVEVDPYAAIPENSSTNVKPSILETSGSEMSPAVESLMLGAKADIAIGKSESAMSKLERGLRIDSGNPQLWYLLAKAHYLQADYQQTISMAKKSIRLSTVDDLIAQNWKLIRLAGERSGDATAIKEALDYSKLNP